MPGRGPVPKVNRIRERDNVRRQAEFTTLQADGVVRGPDLPDVIEWPEQDGSRCGRRCAPMPRPRRGLRRLAVPRRHGAPAR